MAEFTWSSYATLLIAEVRWLELSVRLEEAGQHETAMAAAERSAAIGKDADQVRRWLKHE